MKHALAFILMACGFAQGAELKFKRLSTAEEQPEIWEDMTAQQLWTDSLPGRFDRDRAKAVCSKFKYKEHTFHLPSTAEFAVLARDGGCKILPHMRDSFYWTSTAHDKSPNVRMMFDANRGTSYWVIYNNITYDLVRCVSDAKK